MAYSILDYNKALNQYGSNPNALTYNNALSTASNIQKATGTKVPATTNTSSKSTSSSSGGSSNTSSNLPTSGSFDPKSLTQDQRQSLWEAAGHNGTAPIGYGGESAPVDPAVTMQQEIENDYKIQNDAFTKGLSDYEKASPFNFDDMLAKETKNAKGNISPYYDEILTNFMKGINFLKGNTIQDEQRALTKLQADHDAFQGQAKATLDTALTQVGQDYGNAGSYDSGARSRAQGIQTANTQYEQNQEQRNYEFNVGNTQIQANRVVNQEIPQAVTQENQTVGNQEAGDIYNQAQQLAQYDQQKYNYLKEEAGVAAVPAAGKYGTANTIPGLSSAQTQQTLQSMLPNVQVNNYGGAQATPLMGYQ